METITPPCFLLVEPKDYRAGYRGMSTAKAVQHDVVDRPRGPHSGGQGALRGDRAGPTWSPGAKVFSPNGVDIGRRLVSEALAYRRYSTDYVDAENEARKAKRGMWRRTLVKPWVWRALSPRRRVGSHALGSLRTSGAAWPPGVAISGPPAAPRSAGQRERRQDWQSGVAAGRAQGSGLGGRALAARELQIPLWLRQPLRRPGEHPKLARRLDVEVTLREGNLDAVLAEPVPHV